MSSLQVRAYNHADMADLQHVQNALQGLRALQGEPLSIIKLSEPISASTTSHRTSDVSTSALENPSPASLEADLSHYKVHIMSQLNLHRNHSLRPPGTLLQTPLLLPRTSNQREIPPGHRRRPPPHRRTHREPRTRIPTSGNKSRPESPKRTCRGTGRRA